MTALHAESGAAVDALFPVEGLALPRDHAQALQLALCAHFPWLADDHFAAVHPIKLAPGGTELGLLARRTRLILRVSPQRMAELMVPDRTTLDVAGHHLTLLQPHPRALQPHATLYAYKVAADGPDEVSFMARISQELAALSIGGERVCGKRGQWVMSGQVHNTFSLMLHGLSPEQSLRLQQQGLGPHRLLGCGVFVPHKSAAAV